jgi:hypothetical protein
LGKGDAETKRKQAALQYFYDKYRIAAFMKSIPLSKCSSRELILVEYTRFSKERPFLRIYQKCHCTMSGHTKYY